MQVHGEFENKVKRDKCFKREKNMRVAPHWSEGGNVIREGFIKEVAFELELEGLVWFEYVEMGRKNSQGRWDNLSRSGVGKPTMFKGESATS